MMRRIDKRALADGILAFDGTIKTVYNLLLLVYACPFVCEGSTGKRSRKGGEDESEDLFKDRTQTLEDNCAVKRVRNECRMDNNYPGVTPTILF